MTPVLDIRTFNRLQAVSARFSGIGLTPDLWALTAAELPGLLAFLERIAGGLHG